MEKVVTKYSSHAEAEQADLEYYAKPSYAQKLEIILSLVIPENPENAAIERCVRIYPVAKQK